MKKSRAPWLSLPRGLFAISIPLLLNVACTGGISPRANLQNRGSDTLVNLAQAWAERYRVVAPDVSVAVSGGGSGTGIAALVQGNVDIANSSRSVTDEEQREAQAHSGRDIQEHVVAFDAIALFVHPSNPLDGLTLDELACIYGEGGRCAHWSDVRGTHVPGCVDNQIIRVSRQSNSGTYQYFREQIMGPNRDFALGSMDMNGSKEATDLVAATPCAIGYTGMGYLTSEVKTLCVAEDPSAECFAPNAANALSRRYPIARELFMLTLGDPRDDVAEYLRWVTSDDAQHTVDELGFVPLVQRPRAELR